MTRETRIGLLVGLVFVVMFALILSELTGADSRQAVTVPSGRPTGSGDAAPVIEEPIDGFTRRPTPLMPSVRTVEANPGGGDLSVEGVVTVYEDPDHPYLAAVENPDSSARVDEWPGRARRPAAPMSVRETSPSAPRTPRLPAAASEGPERPEAGGGARGNLPGALRRARRTAAADERGRPADAVARAPQPPRSPRPAAPRSRTYVVQPGDSLIEIARKVYGAEHGDLYTRIHQANRSAVTDPSFVVPGQRLVIPALASAYPAAPRFRRALGELKRDLARMAGGADPHRPRDAAPLPRAARIYRVRRGDNLTKIAREVLNDGSRSAVDRILRANRNKIRNPNVLPVGVELVIPS